MQSHWTLGYMNVFHYLDTGNYCSADLFVLWLLNHDGKDFRSCVVLQTFMYLLQKRNQIQRAAEDLSKSSDFVCFTLFTCSLSFLFLTFSFESNVGRDMKCRDILHSRNFLTEVWKRDQNRSKQVLEAYESKSLFAFHICFG